MSGPTDIRGVPLKVGDTVVLAPQRNFEMLGVLRVGVVTAVEWREEERAWPVTIRTQGSGFPTFRRAHEVAVVVSKDPREVTREQAFQEAVS